MAEQGKNDFDAYRAAKKEIDEETREEITTASQRAYDYGVLAVKNVLLVSSGALLAIPAISGLSDRLEPAMAASAGLNFAIAIGLSVLCIYIIHVNWMSNFHLALWSKQKMIKQVWENYLPDSIWENESESLLNRKEKFHQRLILITFFLPHLFGLGAFVFFAFGCLKLYQSVGH